MVGKPADMNCKRAIYDRQEGRAGHRQLHGLFLFPIHDPSRKTHLSGSVLTSDPVGPQLQVRHASFDLCVVGVVQVTVDDLFGEGHRGVV